MSKLNNDVSRFFIGIITTPIWLPCLIIGGIVAVFVMAGGWVIKSFSGTIDDILGLRNGMAQRVATVAIAKIESEDRK